MVAAAVPLLVVDAAVAVEDGLDAVEEEEEEDEANSREDQCTLSAKVGLNDASGLRSRLIRSFLRLADVCSRG